MRQDINRTLGAKGVRFPVYEFLILFLPVAILILVVGFSFASSRTDVQIEAILDDDDTRLQHISGFIGAQVAVSLNHLIAITAESETIQAIDSPNPSSLQAMEAAFLTLARRNPYYQQIRWIDETGQERVRISRDQAEPYVVPPQDLQNKKHRYYFSAARDLLPGEIYISPVDLNVEWGQIEVPYKPVLRIAMLAVDGQRKPHGAIVMNIEMTHVFRAIDHLRQGGLQVQYVLLNHEGQVLNAPSQDTQYATAGRNSADFADSSPAIWNQVATRNTGKMEAKDGLWTWTTLKPESIFQMMRQAFPQNSPGIDRLVSDDFQLTLLAHRPVEFLLEVRRDSRMLASLGTLLGVAIYGLSMFLYLSGHVRARRAELHTGLAVARAEHIERVRTLEERFHRLFEVSSVGQLVVNEDGRVEVANLAAEQLLHYAAGELKGLSVDDLLPDGQRVRHAQLRAQYLKSPDARKMGEGRRLEALTKDGTRISVEIGLNPYDDDGRLLILVTIIDLSPRQIAQSAPADDQSAAS